MPSLEFVGCDADSVLDMMGGQGEVAVAHVGRDIVSRGPCRCVYKPGVMNGKS
jgi:hypothetical protein